MNAGTAPLPLPFLFCQSAQDPVYLLCHALLNPHGISQVTLVLLPFDVVQVGQRILQEAITYLTVLENGKEQRVGQNIEKDVVPTARVYHCMQTASPWVPPCPVLRGGIPPSPQSIYPGPDGSGNTDIYGRGIIVRIADGSGAGGGGGGGLSSSGA